MSPVVTLEVRLRRANTLSESIASLASVRIGGLFTDHLGQVVERVSEVAVSTRPGYNGILSVSEYIEQITYGERYGNYVILA